MRPLYSHTTTHPSNDTLYSLPPHTPLFTTSTHILLTALYSHPAIHACAGPRRTFIVVDARDVVILELQRVAQTARGWALLQHHGSLLGALFVFHPRGALGVVIRADVGAEAACLRHGGGRCVSASYIAAMASRHIIIMPSRLLRHRMSSRIIIMHAHRAATPSN
jgi:hypothetical protein